MAALLSVLALPACPSWFQDVNQVYVAEFSADGERVLTLDQWGTVRVWSLDDPKNPLVISDVASWRTAVFSPDGELVLVTGVGAMAEMWRADGGGLFGSMDHSGVAAFAGVFSPDGERAATAGADGTIRIWRVGAGDSADPLEAFPNDHGAAVALAYSPDGSMLAAGFVSGKAVVWYLDQAAPPLTLVTPGSPVASVLFSPTKPHLLTSGMPAIRLWDLTPGPTPEAERLLWEALRTISAWPETGHFSPDGEFIGRVVHQRAQVWSVAGGEPWILPAPPGKKRASAMGLSPNGTDVVVVARIGRSWLVSMAGEGEVREFGSAAVHVAFDKAGDRFLTTSVYGVVSVWPSDLSDRPIRLVHPRALAPRSDNRGHTRR
ncbi:WD40 repeat domain-containing protein [bacterium]|nr:WD40 repeat domain-containing protein [bacterium]